MTGEPALDWVRAHNEPTVAELTDSGRFRDMQAQTLEVRDTDERIPYDPFAFTVQFVTVSARPLVVAAK